VVTLLDALFGLDQPQLDEEGRGQFIWQAIDRIPGLHKNELVENVRLPQVYQTIWRYGLDIALSPTPIGQIRNRVETFIAGHPDFLTGQSTPAKVRLLLQELGPTFVKFGQIVSSQTEALPAEWNIELVKLQNTVPSFSYEIARGIISQELGAPPEQLFVTFDPTPLAAASNCVPIWLSDGFKGYLPAILGHFGVWHQPERTRAQGPAPKPRWIPLPGLLYAQVIKRYRRNGVTNGRLMIVVLSGERVLRGRPTGLEEVLSTRCKCG
jgi:hypothetical protein